jgi:hypothetical protein
VKLGFGTYQWWVDSRLDLFDKNVVLGLFHYTGPDGVNEIDIEFARWGNAAFFPGSFTVYPSKPGPSTSQPFGFTLDGTYTTSRYAWSRTAVDYRFSGGFQPIGSDANTIFAWNFRNSTNNIPQKAMPLHINLWLFQGMAPSDGLPVEVIIRGFQKA